MHAYDFGQAKEEPQTSGLLHALARLDRVLDRAATSAAAALGPEAARDGFRGLHIAPRDFERALRTPALSSLLTKSTGEGEGEGAAAAVLGAASFAPFDWLAATFGLTELEADAFLVALAPEIDARYERLYAFLQDDVARRRPTVDFVLSLLCADPATRLAERAAFTADAPLVRHRLLEIEGGADVPLASRALRVDEQIAHHLLGAGGLDGRLVASCEYRDGAGAGSAVRRLEAEHHQELRRLLAGALAEHAPLCVALVGPSSGKLRVVEALVTSLGAPLLHCDLDRLDSLHGFEKILPLVFREAWLSGAVLLLSGADRVAEEPCRALRAELSRGLAEHPGVVVVAAARAPKLDDSGADVVIHPFAAETTPFRRAVWDAALAAHGVTCDDADLAAAADRCRLDPAHIERIAAGIARASTSGRASLRELLEGARALSDGDLAALAEEVPLRRRFGDLVLPPEILDELEALIRRVTHRDTVLRAWGFERALAGGRGIAALFSGPSGTGKTMAAEVIANELGLGLYKINLAGVVSKYIGETEKNLDRVFRAADRSNGVLLFDEADAIFGKRSEVQDAHDRYANLEVAYLLQRIEQFEGIAILTTNLRRNVDDAFMRRFAFTVHFPFPEQPMRRRLWERAWPAGAPLAGDLDLDFLAAQFTLSGGNIRNAALAAAFAAAAAGEPIAMRHVLGAVHAEFRKLGRTLSPAELHGARRRETAAS